jgi:coproporphyrinogen III oxidase-like Fe-S oxidoreductase
MRGSITGINADDEIGEITVELIPKKKISSEKFAKLQKTKYRRISGLNNPSVELFKC